MDIGVIVTAIDNLTAPFNQMDASIKRVGESSQETANRLKAIQVVIAGILLEKSIELTKKFVEMTAEVQNIDLRMAAWSGGMTASGAIMSEFAEKLGASGIKLNEMGNAFIKLRAAGMSVADAKTTVENLVQGIAAVGGGDLAGKLQSASTAFQLMVARGVTDTKVLRQVYTQTGIDARDLYEAMGLSATQFSEKLKEKTLSGIELVTAFNKAAEEKFGGFVTLLGSTVGGALNKFKVDLEESFGHLGNAGAAAQITAIIQNLDAAVKAFIASITKDDIQRFFVWLADIGSVLGTIAGLLINVTMAVASFAQIIARLFNMLPSEALEYGIIGYVLFGKIGALVGILLGTVDGWISAFDIKVASILNHIGVLSDATFQKIKTYESVSTLDHLLKPDSAGPTESNAKGFVARMMGTADQIKKIIADNQAIAAKQIAAGIPSDTPAPVDKSNRINSAIDAAFATLHKTGGQLAIEEMKSSGDQLGATLQGLADKATQMADGLTRAYQALINAKAPASALKEFEDQRVILNQRIRDDYQAEITFQRILNAQKEEEFRLQQQIEISKQQEANRLQNLSTLQLTNPSAAMVFATQGGQVVEQVIAEKIKLEQQINDLQVKIEATGKLITANAANPADVAILRQKIAVYKDSQKAAEAAMQATTAAAVLEKQFWGDLAKTIEGSVTTAISGLLKGTMTMTDALRSLFGSLIDMAVQYLVKLVEIKLFGEAAAAASLAASAPIAAAQLAIWSPAAIAASIATMGGADAIGVTAYQAAIATSVLGFADGGVPALSDMSGRILTGPTMFGLAGEAGPEAIMPLKRGPDGKLGVAGSGGGGAIHLHVTAIDQKSGAEFIMSHMPTISAGLRHARNLNQGQR